MTDKKATKSKKKPAAKKKPAEKKTTKKSSQKKVETVVGKDSLIYVDYSATTKDDGVVFDTTMREVAMDSQIFRENDRYEPMLVAIGWNWLLAALEEELVGMKIDLEIKEIKEPVKYLQIP